MTTEITMNTTSTPTDLATLSTAIADAHDAAQSAVRSALEHARRCGELLIAAKAQVPHGGWLGWLEAHTAVSERTAQAYMRLATHWSALQGKTQHVADLPLRDALALLASSPPQPVSVSTPYIPDAPETARVGQWQDLELWIMPSTRAGFWHVCRLTVRSDGGAFAEGFRRPVRADAIGTVIDWLRFPGSEADWCDVPCVTSEYNHWVPA